MVAFTIFGRDIYRYGIFYLIGFIISYIFLYIIGKKHIFQKFPQLQNLLKNDLETLFIILILGVLIGGRLGHVLIYDFHYFLDNPIDIFKIRQGGMSFIGGLIGVIIGVSIYIWRKKISTKEFIILLDLLACILPLCIAFGRLGNFLNQELYGIKFPTNTVNWSMETIENLKSIGLVHVYSKIDNTLRINTNFLSIIFEGILLFITLMAIFIKQTNQRKRRIGKISIIFLLWYSVVRFILEYIRQDSQSEFIGPFTKSQRFFLIFIVIGVTITIQLCHIKKENLQNK